LNVTPFIPPFRFLACRGANANATQKQQALTDNLVAALVTGSTDMGTHTIGGSQWWIWNRLS
jgi:hypothetical protein